MAFCFYYLKNPCHLTLLARQIDARTTSISIVGRYYRGFICSFSLNNNIPRMPSKAVHESLTPKKRQCTFGDEQPPKKQLKLLHGKIANQAVRHPTALQTNCSNNKHVLAMDCEMVGCGPRGSIGALARCSIVNHSGRIVYDKYIKPQQPITDYRTPWSGIRPAHMVQAIPFTQAQEKVRTVLQNKIVVGHAVYNDFKALGFGHPREMTRDTSRYPALNLLGGFPARSPVSLKRLSRSLLGRTIQQRGHSSVEDARATMDLYKLVQHKWEEELNRKLHLQPTIISRKNHSKNYKVYNSCTK
ncbi:interferon-stimulated 20 kDa exonuclease-like 2 [Branchiostoma floridae]|uniref:RNA exonuclease 4 n=2 Tax=Branchiostoma floridae TaxID=7739 RepID=A0A9J7KSS7_BRAFL|nr:interferon-stimulated 20 kDa exonuclease-like 2 [Branchiostoma floridae]